MEIYITLQNTTYLETGNDYYYQSNTKAEYTDSIPKLMNKFRFYKIFKFAKSKDNKDINEKYLS